jgi:2-desacetyl-2-hydroxyethyl bacteriochlorophyllide A dehydrogenase
MKTRSLWHTGPRKLEVRTIELAEPGPREAMVEVSVCGICAWDLFIYSGGFQNKRAFPFYFGHEGIGRVVACGPGVDIPLGQRVALRESKVVGEPGRGHMAECSLQRADSLVLLPEDEIPDHEYMVEPTACCVNALNISPVHAGERIALVGVGYMGGILLQLLGMGPGREIVAFERRPESLDYVESCNCDTPLRVVDTREVPGSSSLSETEGPFDLVVEAAGTESGFRLADSLVRRGGRLVIFGWHHHPYTFDFGSWHERGLTVHNSSPSESWNMTRCFEQARELIHAARIDQSDLITHVGHPESAREIYEHGLSKTDAYTKGVIRWR